MTLTDDKSAQPLHPTPAWSFRDPQMREFLWFCAPALLLGLTLRVLMTWQMPYGYMQFDSADFLLTTQRFLTKGALVIHSKRTFLVPILYALPFFLKIPALIVIPIAQHLLGLGVVLITGALTRLCLPPWRWVIVPLTMIMAANPNLLWYEHALMSESVYLFCVFALALAATLFTTRRTTLHFTLLLLALFFTAAARPEGRLFLAFGFLLIILVDWGNWKVLWLRLAWLTGLALVTLPLTRTYQAGQLLYATVLPLAPDESKVDPEFGRMIRALRDHIRAHPGVNTELQSLEQKVTDMSGEYLEAKGMHNPDTNSFCQKLAIEACLNQPWETLILAGRKFLLSNDGAISIGYNEPRLTQKLNIGFNRKNMLNVLSKGLVGHDLKDEAAVSAFVRDHYHPFSWYPFLDDTWARFTVGIPVDHVGEAPIPPLPVFFMLAFSGMAIAMAMPGPLQRFHIAWILILSGVWFAVELTGVINARYRFLFEPFCLIYVALGMGLLGKKMVCCFRANDQALKPPAAPNASEPIAKPHP